jgi:hypothetical protein
MPYKKADGFFDFSAWLREESFDKFMNEWFENVLFQIKLCVFKDLLRFQG